MCCGMAAAGWKVRSIACREVLSLKSKVRAQAGIQPPTSNLNAKVARSALDAKSSEDKSSED
jgi:hypothetical protein